MTPPLSALLREWIERLLALRVMRALLSEKATIEATIRV